ncbi:MAG: hypothetical protein FWC11_05480 [Firmicutes bacterium]|nr:hypothetical protein [Bacillota bacterium]MCL2256291.1 hypothetical protein [Bacillota bacterium]
MKKVLRMFLLVAIAIAFSVPMIGCSNDNFSVDMGRVANHFRAEGYLVVGPVTNLGMTSISATAQNDHLAVWRYSDRRTADIGWNTAGTTIELSNLNMTRHREGLYVWYGTSAALAIFDMVVENTRHLPAPSGAPQGFFEVLSITTIIDEEETEILTESDSGFWNAGGLTTLSFDGGHVSLSGVGGVFHNSIEEIWQFSMEENNVVINFFGARAIEEGENLSFEFERTTNRITMTIEREGLTKIFVLTRTSGVILNW